MRTVLIPVLQWNRIERVPSFFGTKFLPGQSRRFAGKAFLHFRRFGELQPICPIVRTTVGATPQLREPINYLALDNTLESTEGGSTT
jgi:hypothetical protein